MTAARRTPYTFAMKSKTVITRLQAREPELRALGAKAMFLFGSVLRGNARADSDVDLFIDYYRNRKFSLVDLVRLKYFLETVLHRPVDVLTRDGIHRGIRDRVIAEAVQVF